MMTELIMISVNSENDVENLRKIRNECRNFMTRNTSEISYEQQQNWFKNLDNTTNKLFLMHEVYCGVAATIIGYGYIRVEDETVLLTGGLVESCRGKGYGQILFNSLLLNSKKFNLPIKLEVLKSNMVAFSVYNKIGFRVTADDGKVIKMEYFYDSVI